MLELGILKGNKEAIWKAETVMGFFPHGLGHHLGLDVHDVSPVPHPPASSTLTSSAGQREVLPISLPPHLNFATPTSSSCSFSSSGDTSILEPNMVVTIEPGIYFNHFLLERFYLSDPTHSQFINTEVLERYWKVGGVRIEDDILVTKGGRGYENLTTAVKGRAMLRVIGEGAGSSGERGETE